MRKKNYMENIENMKNEKALIRVVGISFAVTETPSLAMARPAGTVTLAFEPENKFDKGAIRFDWDGTKIGYVAQWETEEGSTKPMKDADGNKIRNIQREAIRAYHKEHGKFPDAVVDDYSYKPAGTKDFNRDHIGILASIRVELDMAEASDKESDGKNFSHYEKGGEKYERASTILEAFDAAGSKGVDGSLTRWMIDSFSSYNEYRSWMNEKAAAGTDGHDADEIACKAGVLDATTKEEIEAAVKSMSDEDFGRVHPGYWNFAAKECEGLHMIDTEQRVFDDDIMVAGTYDLLLGGAKKVVVDWKSAKSVNLEHIIKTCFYAYLEDADEAWVVAFGSKNKSGYQLKKVGRESIENGYQIMKQVAKAFYFVSDLKASIKRGV